MVKSKPSVFYIACIFISNSSPKLLILSRNCFIDNHQRDLPAFTIEDTDCGKTDVSYIFNVVSLTYVCLYIHEKVMEVRHGLPENIIRCSN